MPYVLGREAPLWITTSDDRGNPAERMGDKLAHLILLDEKTVMTKWGVQYV